MVFDLKSQKWTRQQNTCSAHKSPGLFFDTDNKYIYVYNDGNSTERKQIDDVMSPFEITEQNPHDGRNRGRYEHRFFPIPNEYNKFYMFSGFTFYHFTLN